MSDEQGAAEVPKGSIAVGRRVGIPAGAEPPITVFISGVQQTEGRDYDIVGREIVFRRQIVKEHNIGVSRWLAMYLGLWGTYRKNEVVDLQFRRSGKIELVDDMPIIPDKDAEAPVS